MGSSVLIGILITFLVIILVLACSAFAHRGSHPPDRADHRDHHRHHLAAEVPRGILGQIQSTDTGLPVSVDFPKPAHKSLPPSE